MDTLLALNETVALVGDLDGNIKSIELPENQTPQQREEWFKYRFKDAKHTKRTDEEIDIFTYGPLIPTEKPNVHNISEFHGKAKMQTYTDEKTGLSVRAAFDPFLMEWTVADM
jgi:hypothetical protein